MLTRKEVINDPLEAIRKVMRSSIEHYFTKFGTVPTKEDIVQVRYGAVSAVAETIAQECIGSERESDAFLESLPAERCPQA